MADVAPSVNRLDKNSEDEYEREVEGHGNSKCSEAELYGKHLVCREFLERSTVKDPHLCRL